MSKRLRKWVKRTDPDLVASAYEASREVQLELGSSAQLEHDRIITKIKTLVESETSNPMHKLMYVSYAQSIPQILKKYPQHIAVKEIASLALSWIHRGLDKDVLIKIAKSFGVDPTPYTVMPSEEFERLYNLILQLQGKTQNIQSEIENIRGICENLNQRLTTIERIVLGVEELPFIVGVAMAGYVQPAGFHSTLQPFTAHQGASIGMPMPISAKFKNMYVLILSNNLNGSAIIRLLKNEEPTPLTVAIPAYETGVFSNAVDVTYNEGDRILFEVDLRDATEGDIDIVTIVCRVDPLVKES